MAVDLVTLNDALSWTKSCLKEENFELEFLPAEASGRTFFRVKKKIKDKHKSAFDDAYERNEQEVLSNLIIVIGPDKSENLNWFNLGKKLWGGGLALPKIFCHDHEKGFYAMEDLGSDRLDSYCRPGASAKKLLRAYVSVAETLAHWHDRALSAAGHLSKINPPYDPESIKSLEWDYFINGLRLINLAVVIHDEIDFEAQKLCQAVSFKNKRRVLIHRDFQSRNVMMTPSGPKILDWQGARIGPATYDLGSLLWDPYVSLSPSVRAECVEAYLKARKLPASHDLFWEDLSLSSLMRLMQAVGAYAKLSKIGHQSAYAAYLLPALTRMSEITQFLGSRDYPMIYELIEASLQALKNLT
ncbi:MAG: phosphotransferase [Deltaproteobacteria bacterium]|jgi:aminoglycoside/choline kinase family phosphotransferase|nr:phosphotransferase [Deltaproteobacteria bacterium]